MTKKITCRVIDSVPLSCDNSDLHLGWCLNTKIYSGNGPQNTNPKVWKDQNHSNTDAPKTLDCFA